MTDERREGSKLRAWDALAVKRLSLAKTEPVALLRFGDQYFEIMNGDVERKPSFRMDKNTDDWLALFRDRESRWGRMIGPDSVFSMNPKEGWANIPQSIQVQSCLLVDLPQASNLSLISRSAFLGTCALGVCEWLMLPQ